MDVSAFKKHQWLVIGGAAGMLVFGFLKWVTIKVSGFGAGFSSSGGNVFDFFFTGTIPWLLLMGAGVVTVLLAMKKLPQKLPWPLIILAATGLAALLLLLRLLINPIDGKDAIESLGGSVGRGPGMILSTLAGIVAAVGGFLGFKESGGDLADLKDVDKLKSAFSDFGGGSGQSTPPPPQDMTPPPPPPGFPPPPPPAS